MEVQFKISIFVTPDPKTLQRGYLGPVDQLTKEQWQRTKDYAIEQVVAAFDKIPFKVEEKFSSCPRCNLKLVVDPTIIALSDPPKICMKCPKCTYQESRPQENHEATISGGHSQPILLCSTEVCQKTQL